MIFYTVSDMPQSEVDIQHPISPKDDNKTTEKQDAQGAVDNSPSDKQDDEGDGVMKNGPVDGMAVTTRGDEYEIESSEILADDDETKIPDDFYYDVMEHISSPLVSEESGLPKDLLTLQYPLLIIVVHFRIKSLTKYIDVN